MVIINYMQITENFHSCKVFSSFIPSKITCFGYDYNENNVNPFGAKHIFM